MSRSEMNVIALTWAATGLGKTKTISRVRTAIVWRTPKKPLLNTLLFAVWTNLLTNPRFRKTVHVSCNRGLNTLLLRVKAAKRIGLRGPIVPVSPGQIERRTTQIPTIRPEIRNQAGIQ